MALLQEDRCHLPVLLRRKHQDTSLRRALQRNMLVCAVAMYVMLRLIYQCRHLLALFTPFCIYR